MKKDQQFLKFSFFKKLLPFLAAILTIFLFKIPESFAASDAFLSEVCNASNIATGTAGKVIAAFAIVAVGIGFFSGKVSWGLLIGVSAGVGLMFGAPSIVSAISDKSTFECQSEVTYVTTCSDGVCSSCPQGKTGPGCSTCLTGFTGANCATCDTGYTGDDCDQCIAPQYTKVGGVCVLSTCNSGAITGVAAANKVVNLGNGSINCDATNYSGSITYSCSNGVFSNTGGSCSCPAKYDQSNCTSCATGYAGAPGCNGCDTNYTKVGGVCQQDCAANGIPGIPEGTPAIPASGTLTCTVSGYAGTIDYTCSNGSFSASNSCGGISNCFDLPESNSGTLTAPAGKVWTSVVFASYGTPNSCSVGACNATNSVDIVSAACVGRSACVVTSSNGVFGDPCFRTLKRLQIKMTYQ
jgi:type IV secretory pathway VirB2 component (pilin)